MAKNDRFFRSTEEDCSSWSSRLGVAITMSGLSLSKSLSSSHQDLHASRHYDDTYFCTEDPPDVALQTATDPSQYTVVFLRKAVTCRPSSFVGTSTIALVDCQPGLDESVD